jgi:hypothetical protein
MTLTSDQVRVELNEMHSQGISTYAVTPKIEAQIKKDLNVFADKLQKPGKDNKKTVEAAVRCIIAYALGNKGLELEIKWAHELKPADLVERPYTNTSIRGRMGTRYALSNIVANLRSLERATANSTKWGAGNIDGALWDLIDSEVSARTRSFRERGRLDLVVNGSKILSSHIYRLRKKAPELPLDQKREPERDAWGYNRYWPDYFRSMFPINLADLYVAFIVSKHFVKDGPVANLLATCYTIFTNLYAMYFRENQVILVEKPELHMLETGNLWNRWQLHNESGPAVHFPKLGKSVYCLNGVHVPKEIVTTPVDKLDPQMMVRTRNVEVRRELVRKLGIERIFDALGATILDASEDGKYELVSLNIGDNRQRPYLKMLNPSIGTWHFEGVEPRTATVAEALRFRNNTSDIPEVLT